MHKSTRLNAGSAGSFLFRPWAAGLMLGSAGSLSAEIIYNTTPIGGATGINDYNFGILTENDFLLHTASRNDPDKPDSWVTIDPLSSGTGITGEVALDDVIGPESVFGDLWLQVGVGQHYYGFSMTDGSTLLYGWLSVTHLESGDLTGSATVDGWAYDDTGASVTVGPIPEPAATAAFSGAAAALLAGSAVVWKRRRQKIAARSAA